MLWGSFSGLAETFGYTVDGLTVACLVAGYEHPALVPAVAIAALLRGLIEGPRKRSSCVSLRTGRRICCVLDGVAIALTFGAPAPVLAVTITFATLVLRLWVETADA